MKKCGHFFPGPNTHKLADVFRPFMPSHLERRSRHSTQAFALMVGFETRSAIQSRLFSEGKHQLRDSPESGVCVDAHNLRKARLRNAGGSCEISPGHPPLIQELLNEQMSVNYEVFFGLDRPPASSCPTHHCSSPSTQRSTLLRLPQHAPTAFDLPSAAFCSDPPQSPRKSAYRQYRFDIHINGTSKA